MMSFNKQLNSLLRIIEKIYDYLWFSFHDYRCHHPRDSLFSWSSKFNNFTGLVNWGFLLLTIGGFRLLLENFIKYGIRIDPMQWIIVLTGEGEGEGYPSLILLACKLFFTLNGNFSNFFFHNRYVSPNITVLTRRKRSFCGNNCRKSRHDSSHRQYSRTCIDTNGRYSCQRHGI